MHPLDEELRNDGIKMIAPHRSNLPHCPSDNFEIGSSENPDKSNVKKTALNRRNILLGGTTLHAASVIVTSNPVQLAEAGMQQKQAISATVTGDDQQVGFRAMVMKQAIEYNLAGSAKNERNEIVQFTLQGDANRLDLAVAAIREGTKKSSDIDVITSQTAVDPVLSTFTVIDWTSTSRNITNPYTLVFKLRANDKVISKSEAKDVWHEILRTTLKGDDLQKLGDDDWEDDEWEDDDWENEGAESLG